MKYAKYVWTIETLKKIINNVNFNYMKWNYFKNTEKNQHKFRSDFMLLSTQFVLNFE